MNKTLLLAAGALAIMQASCNKNTSKLCTYYNKPLQASVGFVGYFDYELNEIVIHQFERNTDFKTLIKSDRISNNAIAIKNDTSEVLFDVGNKVDYMIELPQKQDTFYLTHINYQPEYFDIEEPSGKCDQKKAYSQLPDSVTINNTRSGILKTSPTQAHFYLEKL